MVRDLSAKYGKQVSLKLVGAATLVDKAVLEKLYDPLVHLVRNAFGHGTESAEERIAQGKPPEATIEIRAYHRGNQTFIEVRDDGRGIDPAQIRLLLIERGLLSEDEAATASNEQLYSYLFSPNFSTASSVSELSGRGMGLSAVQLQVAGLKGNVAIASELGKGTAFIIRIPLTLTITKLLVFKIDANIMAVPVDTLMAIIAATNTDIQTIQGQPFYRYQEQLIPLYPASAFCEHYPLPKTNLGQTTLMTLPEEDQVPLLIIASGEDVIALEIDRILNEQELVIKPFGKTITPPSYLYGCTILGDGSLVPVIDGAELIRKWLHHKPTAKPQLSLEASLSAKHDDVVLSKLTTSRQNILIIDDSLTTRQNLLTTLRKSGYDVMLAGDGREGLEKLKQEPNVQAVFCDVEMPNMNGFEFLNACRKDPKFSSLPVIMLTSRSGQRHRDVAKLLGATAYLTKPYLEQDLIKTLKESICSNSV